MSAWLEEPVGDLISRYQVGDDGRTRCERHKEETLHPRCCQDRSKDTSQTLQEAAVKRLKVRGALERSLFGDQPQNCRIPFKGHFLLSALPTSNSGISTFLQHFCFAVTRRLCVVSGSMVEYFTVDHGTLFREKIRIVHDQLVSFLR